MTRIASSPLRQLILHHFPSSPTPVSLPPRAHLLPSRSSSSARAPKSSAALYTSSRTERPNLSPANPGALDPSMPPPPSRVDDDAAPAKVGWDIGRGEGWGPPPVDKGKGKGKEVEAKPEEMKAGKPKPKSRLRARTAAITLSPTAVHQLKRLSDAKSQTLRIGVKNKGCSGMSYHLEYVDRPGKFDEVVEQDGVKVLVDSKALFSVIGSQMDWEEGKLSSKFVFHNPNIKESCGCGESFMV